MISSLITKSRWHQKICQSIADERWVTQRAVLTTTSQCEHEAYRRRDSIHTQSPCLLLKLPKEIQSRIYGYVLGGQVLHIFERRRSMETPTIWSSQICHHGLSALKCDSDLIGNDTYHQDGCPGQVICRCRAKQLATSILYVNKEIHDIARMQLYSTNTLEFSSFGQCALFARLLIRSADGARQNLKMVRSIQISITHWSSALFHIGYVDEFLEFFAALTAFTAHLDFSLTGYGCDKSAFTVCLNELLRFRALPLTRLDVTVAMKLCEQTPEMKEEIEAGLVELLVYQGERISFSVRFKTPKLIRSCD